MQSGKEMKPVRLRIRWVVAGLVHRELAGCTGFPTGWGTYQTRAEELIAMLLRPYEDQRCQVHEI